MKLSPERSIADAFPSPAPSEAEELTLKDGSRIAVIGGGPAGSFFSYFLLRLADSVDLDIHVDLYEPRSFSVCGPGGCNHCGGIVSETLVQNMAAEGINLPPRVVQRGIGSYMVHMDAGMVRIGSPAQELRIAALYRGNGPRTAEDMPWESFDGFLQSLAKERGATLVSRLVTGVDWTDGRPSLRTSGGGGEEYDLVVVATGVNSNFLRSLEGPTAAVTVPRTTQTFICEFRSTEAEIERVMGDSMHVFLLDIPRLEFGALIPKGEFVTVVMLGHEIDRELVEDFLDSPEVRRCLPEGLAPRVCNCSPLINMGGVKQPFADRMVLIGDSGVTRLYKDGIGAAFRTAKAAASTSVFRGISSEAFREGYWPVCRSIARDNAIGKGIFAFTTVIKHSRVFRRALLRMTEREQMGRGTGPLSSILWNMFTGSAPYGEIFLRSLHPGFIAGLLWNLLLGLRPAQRPIGSVTPERVQTPS